MSNHYCKTSDGMNKVCFCIRGIDHTEAEFDQPVEAIPSNNGSGVVPSPDAKSKDLKEIKGEG